MTPASLGTTAELFGWTTPSRLPTWTTNGWLCHSPWIEEQIVLASYHPLLIEYFFVLQVICYSCPVSHSQEERQWLFIHVRVSSRTHSLEGTTRHLVPFGLWWELSVLCDTYPESNGKWKKCWWERQRTSWVGGLLLDLNSTAEIFRGHGFRCHDAYGN